ncbi:MAG: class I SAM-dependent DNA methyltransferase [Chloroflexota bacterium]|nr:MAG: class I SAM-dependent DNA methyltransferase [Chloroflexota bacterium]
MSLVDFVERWRDSTLTERAAAHQHFLDLCAVLGQPTPAASDATGAFYTFEKKVTTVTGATGFVDVWLKGRFAWEYKGKRRDLATAYQQIQTYREGLDNPPLMVVCDFERFEVHTNFTGTSKKVYRFSLDDLLTGQPLEGSDVSALEILRSAFTNPDHLKPAQTRAQVTEAAAAEFARLAESLHASGVVPEHAAHFLMRLLFCLFAEDIGLLPDRLFTRLVHGTIGRPSDFTAQVRELFRRMATGGYFGVEEIAHFNGGLFADDVAFAFTSDDLRVLDRATKLDWSSIEPAIFGTLFERSLDPSKRSQLGAHYTSRDDILLIVEPVLMAPLRREWNRIRAEAVDISQRRDGAAQGSARTRYQQLFTRLLTGFADRIAAVRVLDPACGSGNFLYVSLRQLLDLEKEVITFAARNGLSAFFPHVGPAQLHGIEVNAYAHELAQVVVWIGYIQWLNENGFGIMNQRPILSALTNIMHRDAILDRAGEAVQPPWPSADVVVGNPPFLGGKRLRAELGDAYVDDLFRVYDDRVPREADLVCYWFERARALIAAGELQRAGLLATNSVRGGANRRVLERIQSSGGIFMAWSDRPWVLEGAAVRVSMVGFDDGRQTDRTLDGMPVVAINPDLTSTVDLTTAGRLAENADLAFMGDTKGGPFDISADIAQPMLAQTNNPNGRPNSDVVRPWVNGLDVTRRPRDMWIVDFGTDMSEAEAALYEAPFELVRKSAKEVRAASRTTRAEWWLHERPRVEMRKALFPLSRFIATPTVAKHRLFVWLREPVLPDHQLIVIARSDDYFFGVLHSRVHEAWSLEMCTWLGVGNDPRYTPSSTFETFPFPWPPGTEPKGDARVEAIARAARDLVQKRDRWLNPPGASADEVKKLTLTNLYNARPAWLSDAHRELDRAVLSAYGWPAEISDDDLLVRLLELNRQRGDQGARSKAAEA